MHAVHVHDLKLIPEQFPWIYEEFTKGSFITQKSNRMFSMLPHDQIHEQINAVVKGDGGAIGLTEYDPVDGGRTRSIQNYP